MVLPLIPGAACLAGWLVLVLLVFGDGGVCDCQASGDAAFLRGGADSLSNDGFPLRFPLG